jgi:high-affinity Fe2+/Pb2+ permease
VVGVGPGAQRPHAPRRLTSRLRHGGTALLNGVYELTAYRWLTQQTEAGKFLAAMFGWDPRPSIEQVVAWMAFAAPVTWLFLRRTSAPRAVPVGASPARQRVDAA